MRPESVAPRRRLRPCEKDVESQKLAVGVRSRLHELSDVCGGGGGDDVEHVADQGASVRSVVLRRHVVVFAGMGRRDPADDDVRVIDVSARRLCVVFADGRGVSVFREALAVHEFAQVVRRHVRMGDPGERVRDVAVRVDNRKIDKQRHADDCSACLMRRRRLERG